MSKEEREWLDHLTTSVPKEAYGYTISLYSIALEGWRRGLTLRFLNQNRKKSETTFTLSDGVKTHRFSITRGDKVPLKAVKICINKDLTKKYLLEAGVPTPEGKVFSVEQEKQEIINYAKKLGFPLVIKPVDGTAGHGVIANIKNRSQFLQALCYVTEDLKYKKIIVEKHFEGIDSRVYVIEDKVIGAIKRVPAYVIGDGISTITELIKLKEKERFKNPALYGRRIRIDNEVYNLVEQQGYTMDSIPHKGEQVLLKTKNNVSAGGESIDITDELTDEIKEIAINAGKAIPGLVQYGVDLMINFENNTASVIEVNSRPHITAQLFPEKGKARNIPKAIIDYYFPETKPNYQKPLYYFDFRYVWDSFQNGYTKQITIPDIPKGNLITKKFIITGNLQRINFGSWIQKHVNYMELNGFIEYLTNGNVSLVVSGENNKIEKLIKLITTNFFAKEKIENITEQLYDKPIKVGFEIINEEIDKPLPSGYHPIRLEGIREELLKQRYKINKQSKSKENNKIDYKKEYEKVINSTSWKITKPLRKIKKMFK